MRSAFTRLRLAAGLGTLALVLAACGGSQEGALELAIVAPDLPSASSQLMCPADRTQPLSATGAEVLRITVFQEDTSSPQGLLFVCDRVFPVVPHDETSAQPRIYAPLPKGRFATIVAETWKTGQIQTDAGVPGGGDAGTAGDDAGAMDAGGGGSGTTTGLVLAASGRVRHVDTWTPGRRTLVVDRARGFDCALGLLGSPRAFHTATALPDGRVAIVGGLSLGPSASSLEITVRNKVYATASIEIFDPETQTFAAPSDPGRSAAPVRAFHTAYQLPAPEGKAALLLLGGLTSKDQTEFEPVVEIDGTTILDVIPNAEARSAPAEIVEIDLATLEVTRRAPTRQPLGRFMHGSTEDPPAPFASAYPLVAGGATEGQGKNLRPKPQTTFEFLDVTSNEPAPVLSDAPPMAGAGRLGATVTSLGLQDTGSGVQETWLILGGNIFSPPANVDAEVAEYVSAATVDGRPQSATAAFTTFPGIPATAFHTATPVRDQDGRLAILVAGGFVIQPSTLAPTELAAIDPVAPGSGLPLLSLITGPSQTVSLSPPPGFKAVGFHDAVRLLDDSVLITGGSPYNPQASGYPNECPFTDECRPVADPCPGARLQQDSRQCALCQAARYFHDRDAGKRRVESEGNLLIARFGHRSTLLWDGRVLVTGGITSRLGANACSGTDILMMLRSAEIYNPQLATDDVLATTLDPSSESDPPALLPARQPGQGTVDECCTCPSTVDEARALAKRCAGTRKACVW